MGRLTVVIIIVLSFLVPCHSKIYAKDIDPNKARHLFRKAEILYSQHEIDLALKNYLAAIDLFPSMPKAYYRIGVIYSTFKGRYYKSIRFFRKSIKYDSQDPNPYYGLGITYCIVGNERLGSKYLMKAGIIFFKEGNIDAALSIYDVLRQTREKDSTQKLARAIENHSAGKFLYPFRVNGKMGDSPVRSRDSGGGRGSGIDRRQLKARKSLVLC